MKKTFGIIGAGNIAQTVAKHLIKAGYGVTLSNSKDPDSLKDTVASLGAGVTAGTPEDAAKADIVLLALPWSGLSTLSNLTDWKDKVVIDATNAFISYAPDFRVADLGGRASSEVVAGQLPGARLVKAFNTLYFKILALNPEEAGGRRVLFYSGNDAAAKKEVGDVIESLGFAAIDLGDLATGSKLQEPKQAVATLNLIKL
ncbi:MAG: NADPH-dependent F420 reductase [Bacteroidota bacterium]